MVYMYTNIINLKYMQFIKIKYNILGSKYTLLNYNQKYVFNLLV